MHQWWRKQPKNAHNRHRAKNHLPEVLAAADNIMIYTLGCSFTKWHWPTWSDWLAVYAQEPVTNWAYPGLTNSAIYYKLLDSMESITAHDTVYIMWTGNNRSCLWYDADWVEQHDCHGFFPDRELWFGSKTYTGLYKTHPDYLPSLTHMIIDNLAIIFNTQLLLDRLGCRYHMMFWQNPWLDTRETYKPSFDISWNKKQHISQSEIDQARSIMSLGPVASLLENLDWSKFVQKPDRLDQPAQYTGLWEYLLSSPELIMLNHVRDRHPNTAAHHDWLTEKILQVPGQHADTARDLSQHMHNMEIPSWSSTAVIDGWHEILNQYPLDRMVTV